MQVKTERKVKTLRRVNLSTVADEISMFEAY